MLSLTTERRIVRFDRLDLRYNDLANVWRGRCAVANGCFDLLHPGHLAVIRELDKLCFDYGLHPLVLLNSDLSVGSLKGSSRPVVPEESRATLIANLRWPVSVVLFDQPTPIEAMDDLRPSWIVKGGDYRAQDVVVSSGAQVRIVPHVDGWSTTRILERR